MSRILGCCLVGIALMVAASVSAPSPEEKPPTKPTLVLRTVPETTKYERYDPTHLHLEFFNPAKAPLVLRDMPTHGNRLDRAEAVHFVVRFSDGTLAVEHLRVHGTYSGFPPKLLLRPLTLPPEGSAAAVCHIVGCIDSEQATQAWVRTKAFRVTACIPALKLQSNPVYFNGYDPKKDKEKPDAFKDLAEWEKRKKAEADAKKREREERERRAREEGR